jgi:hypothetical protein
MKSLGLQVWHDTAFYSSMKPEFGLYRTQDMSMSISTTAGRRKIAQLQAILSKASTVQTVARLSAHWDYKTSDQVRFKNGMKKLNQQIHALGL